MNVSYRRASFAESQRDTSKFFTSPAIRDANALASKRVIGPIPLRPATIVGHASRTPMPTGETMPSPVTTTRRNMSGIRNQGTGISRGDVSGGATRVALQWPRPGRREGAGASVRAPADEPLLLKMRADVVDRLLHRGDLFRVVVGNLGFEFLFERHDELDRVERIGAEVVDER